MGTRHVDGTRVRQVRRDAGLSVMDLVDRMRQALRPVHPDLIYKIERGANQPSEKTLAALVEALRCDRTDLLEQAA